MTAQQISINLLLPCPKSKPGKEWGDLFFGRSLMHALQEQGAQVRLHFASRRRWWPPFGLMAAKGVDLVLRGKKAHKPLGGRPFFMWLISQPETLTEEELAGCAHIFVASESYARTLSERGYSVSVLLQCTDPRIFAPRGGATDPDVVFVGNQRKKFRRKVVEAALSGGFKPDVWGRGWDQGDARLNFRGQAVANSELGTVYAAAGCVLNDHTQSMKEYGFPSNRVFDVLASGTPIVTEDMQSLPADMREGLFLYAALGEVPEAVRKAIAAKKENPEKFAALATRVRENHSFAARARVILDRISRTIRETGAEDGHQSNGQNATMPGQMRVLADQLCSKRVRFGRLLPHCSATGRNSAILLSRDCCQSLQKPALLKDSVMRKLLFSIMSACLLASPAAAWKWNPNHPIVPLEVAVHCAATQGVYDRFQLSYPRVGGLKTIVVHKGPYVTADQAELINRCIEYYGGMNATGQRTETIHVGGIFGNRTIRVKRERCAAVLTGGDNYCIKRPWY